MTGRDDFTCERFEAHLEPYLDADLDGETATACASHLAGCARCAAELAHGERVRDALRRLPRLEAPAPAVAAVLATARGEARSTARPGWRWLDALRARPALAAAGAALVLAIALVAVFEPGSGSREPAHDDSAVARATLETKLALAHFGRANRRIGRGLSAELLRERVVRPAVRSLHRAPQPDGAPIPERG